MKDLLKRFAAFYIDGLFIVVLTYIFYFIFHFIKQDFDLSQNINLEKLALCQLISYFLYFTILESILKTTFGKRFLKFNVKYLDDTDNIWWRNFLRSFMRIFPLNAISFLFNSKKVFWHELLSKSRTLKIV